VGLCSVLVRHSALVRGICCTATLVQRSALVLRALICGHYRIALIHVRLRTALIHIRGRTALIHVRGRTALIHVRCHTALTRSQYRTALIHIGDPVTLGLRI
jgi:hypothetical protein